ncbi:DUF2723 domain-containing protein [Candidatus Woesearchaeota archaeon]|nr:DUF2723 domain-containing protein [Candidatus Woesearchaeota archaeon]
MKIKEFWIAILIFVLCMTVYSFTLAPTIYVGDSGEITAAAYLLGISHPTGFPSYMLLGKLFMTIFPFGSIAWRLNVFSALMASLTCVVLYYYLRLLKLNKILSFGSSLGFAFSLSFWSQAVIQRVYTLNSLFFVSSLYFLTRWYLTKEKKNLYYVALFVGLGITNHTIMIVMGAVMFLFILSVNWRVFLNKKVLKYGTLIFILALSLYLYLPIRSSMDPAFDWGNPENIPNLINYLSREQFWWRAYVHDFRDIAKSLVYNFIQFFREFFVVGFLFSLIGIYFLFKKDKKLSLLFLGLIAGNLFIMLLHGNKADIMIWFRYYIPSYLVLAVFMGVGFNDAVSRIKFKTEYWNYLILVIPLLFLFANYQVNDRSRHYYAYDINYALLNHLEENATLFAGDDNFLFVLIYLYHVEGVRNDVNFILRDLGQNLGYFKFNPDEDDVYYSWIAVDMGDQLELEAHGLAYKVKRKGAEIEWNSDLVKHEIRGIDDETIHKDYMTRNMLGDYFFVMGNNFEKRNFEIADSYYKLASKTAYDNAVLHHNVALIYERNGYYERALDELNKAAAIDDKAIFPEKNKEYSNSDIERIKALMEKAELIGEDENKASNSSSIADELISLQAALESDPDNIEILQKLGDMYMKLELPQLAEQYYGRIEELNAVNKT